MLKDHKAVMPVWLEPAALQSQVKDSTTKPLRSLELQSDYLQEEIQQFV